MNIEGNTNLGYRGPNGKLLKEHSNAKGPESGRTETCSVKGAPAAHSPAHR